MSPVHPFLDIHLRKDPLYCDTLTRQVRTYDDVTASDWVNFVDPATTSDPRSSGTRPDIRCLNCRISAQAQPDIIIADGWVNYRISGQELPMHSFLLVHRFNHRVWSSDIRCLNYRVSGWECPSGASFFYYRGGVSVIRCLNCRVSGRECPSGPP